MLTPRQRVETAIQGGWVDKIPLTIDYNEFFLCAEERELRDRGMCVVEQRIPLYVEENPEIAIRTVHYRGKDGLERAERIIETPEGVVSEVLKVLPGHPRVPGELMPWHEEHFFKSVQDYAPIEFAIRQRRYVSNLETFVRLQEQSGGDVVFQTGIDYSPLQEIIYNIMGIERFAMEWHHRRSRVMDLFEALVADRRKIYPLVVESPTPMVGYCGNIVPEVVGPKRFEEYILPHLNELGEMLHERGKLLSVHFDANTRLLAPAIADSQIDIIESFTPLPDGDMSVAEARAMWRDKVLWINFPSSLHHLGVADVKEATRQILREAECGDRFLIGIKELIPKQLWQTSLLALSDVLEAEGKLPLR